MDPRKNKCSTASTTISKTNHQIAEEMCVVLKDIFGSMFESMLQGAVYVILGYVVKRERIF